MNWTFFIRIFLTGMMVCAIYKETGIWTAIFTVLVTAAIESIQFQINRLRQKERP